MIKQIIVAAGVAMSLSSVATAYAQTSTGMLGPKSHWAGPNCLKMQFDDGKIYALHNGTNGDSLRAEFNADVGTVVTAIGNGLDSVCVEADGTPVYILWQLNQKQ